MTKTDHGRRYVLIIMLAAFLIGLAVSNHYGTYYDQYMEENICMVNISAYANRILHTDWMTISEHADKDHGAALYYPLGVFCLLDGQSVAESFAWHCYTYLLFFGGCLALYGIMYELFQSRRLAMVTFGLLYLSPRFFAEGHYNNKDIVLMALGLVTVYFGIRYIRGQRLTDGLLFALAAAFMTNVKIIGAWFLAVPGGVYLCWNLWQKKLDWRKLLEGVGVLLTFALVFVLITPASWDDPVAFTVYCLTNASSYSRWSGLVLYAGKWREVPLPADYLPLQILYTTPLPLLLLCLIGHVRAVLAIVRRETNALLYLMFLLLYLVPFAYAILDRDLVVYNGWRHFYFLYGPLAVFMGVGCAMVTEWLKDQRLGNVLCGGVLAYLAVLVVAGHPYQYSYINCLAARPAQGDWQLDYWCVGGMNALDKLYDSDVRNKEYALTVTGEGTLKADIERFGARWNGELTYVEPDADTPANYLVVDLTYDHLPKEDYRLLTTQEAYGNCLYEVYERVDGD